MKCNNCNNPNPILSIPYYVGTMISSSQFGNTIRTKYTFSPSTNGYRELDLCEDCVKSYFEEQAGVASATWVFILPLPLMLTINILFHTRFNIFLELLKTASVLPTFFASVYGIPWTIWNLYKLHNYKKESTLKNNQWSILEFLSRQNSDLIVLKENEVLFSPHEYENLEPTSIYEKDLF